MKRALIIGGGFGGCTVAHELSKKRDWHITLVHPYEQLGGGVRTRYQAGHPFTYGPRHLITQSDNVFEYLNSIVPLRLCKEHQFISFVNSDKNFYSYPIHYDDIPRMPDSSQIYTELEKLEENFKNTEFKLTVGSPKLEAHAKNYEDFWIRSVGPTLYEKFIRDYTKKMWLIDDNTVIDDFTWSPKGIAIKKGPREGWDTAISAYPIALDGYNHFFDSAKEKVDLFIKGLVASVEPGSLKAEICGNVEKFDLIINTASLDDIFTNQYKELSYIGRRIEFIVLPTEFALPKDVYFAYYTGLEEYTRVVEYKKFSRHSSTNTLISIEYPCVGGGKLYPMPAKKCRDQYKQYVELCHDDFRNIGRIALYNYRYDIDDVIEQALSLVSSI